MTQRRHKRFSLTGIATLQYEDEGKDKTIHALLSSISSVGIGVYADNPIEANKQISISMDFISIGGLQNTVIQGSVVYNKDLGNIHFVGIQFNEEVNSENQPLLDKHIKHLIASH
jgi:hypothetical protein